MRSKRADNRAYHDDKSTSYAAETPELRQHWSLDSIDWSAIRGDAIGEPDAFFYLVAAASFMESTTDRYTANLIAQFCGEDEITAWLELNWLPEELQHGRALRRYVQIAWPNFDWDRAYEAFLDEFSGYCRGDELEPTLTREMASRCVVEMGTAGYYVALSRMSRDPPLTTIATRIAEDEIRHYKHFYRYFRRYQQTEPESRSAVFGALLNRLRMIDGQDGVIAIKHLYAGVHPGKPFDRRTYRALRSRWRPLMEPHFPHRMCVQMLLKPLGLGPRTRRIALPLAEAFARRVFP
jgi:hypothetical protein